MYKWLATCKPHGAISQLCPQEAVIHISISFFTNLSKSSAKQAALAAAYQFSCFSEYTKNSQQA
jgi:hypothetical protein